MARPYFRANRTGTAPRLSRARGRSRAGCVLRRGPAQPRRQSVCGARCSRAHDRRASRRRWHRARRKDRRPNLFAAYPARRSRIRRDARRGVPSIDSLPASPPGAIPHGVAGGFRAMFRAVPLRRGFLRRLRILRALFLFGQADAPVRVFVNLPALLHFSRELHQRAAPRVAQARAPRRFRADSAVCGSARGARRPRLR